MANMLEDLIHGLPDQFDNKVTGRVLILDADTYAYKAAATSKKLETALRKFQMMVLERMFITKSETARVHLTHADCLKAGRGNILAWRGYQDNRNGKSKPPLLDVLREAAAQPENMMDEYTCTLHKTIEADDACMIDSYSYKEMGILDSADKDLRHTPYNYYDGYTGKTLVAKGVGSLWLHTTESGNTALHGIGRLFFWAQMLMGDAADNIRGLDKYYGSNIGHMRTLEILEVYNDTDDESRIANLVFDAYRTSDQNPLPEGWLLHMMRSHTDTFKDVLDDLDLSEKNRKFIYEDCFYREWFKAS